MSRSIYHITYTDLIREQERTLVYLRRKLEWMERNGQIHKDAAKRRILIQERILKLLTKSKKDFQQADLFKLNDQFNKEL